MASPGQLRYKARGQFLLLGKSAPLLLWRCTDNGQAQRMTSPCIQLQLGLVLVGEAGEGASHASKPAQLTFQVGDPRWGSPHSFYLNSRQVEFPRMVFSEPLPKS